MSQIQSHLLANNRSLLKATVVAACTALILLITVVLPAEYHIDPTGVGRLLGFDALKQSNDTKSPLVIVPTSVTADVNAVLLAKAETIFGKHAGRSLDAAAVSLTSQVLRRDSLTLTLAAGKGTEVKARLQAGAGLTFHWQATAAVVVDMHGEQPDAKGAWTSYSVESAQNEAAGTFIAPFTGSHGWYWKNRGTEPVTLTIEVYGFQSELYQP